MDARGFADAVIRTDRVLNRHLQVVTLYDPLDPLREVDLFASYPLRFPELLAQAVGFTIGARRILVASIPYPSR